MRLFDAIFIYLFVSFQHAGKKKRKSGPWKGEDLTWVKQTDTHICPGLPIMGCLRRWWLSSMAPSYYERGVDIYSNQIQVWTLRFVKFITAKKWSRPLVELVWLNSFGCFLALTKTAPLLHTIVKFSCLCYFLMDLWSLVIQKFI